MKGFGCCWTPLSREWEHNCEQQLGNRRQSLGTHSGQQHGATSSQCELECKRDALPPAAAPSDARLPRDLSPLTELIDLAMFPETSRETVLVDCLQATRQRGGAGTDIGVAVSGGRCLGASS